eukprot:gene3232-2379_t
MEKVKQFIESGEEIDPVSQAVKPVLLLAAEYSEWGIVSAIFDRKIAFNSIDKLKFSRKILTVETDEVQNFLQACFDLATIPVPEEEVVFPYDSSTVLVSFIPACIEGLIRHSRSPLTCINLLMKEPAFEIDDANLQINVLPQPSFAYLFAELMRHPLYDATILKRLLQLWVATKHASRRVEEEREDLLNFCKVIEDVVVALFACDATNREENLLPLIRMEKLDDSDDLLHSLEVGHLSDHLNQQRIIRIRRRTAGTHGGNTAQPTRKKLTGRRLLQASSAEKLQAHDMRWIFGEESFIKLALDKKFKVAFGIPQINRLILLIFDSGRFEHQESYFQERFFPQILFYIDMLMRIITFVLIASIAIAEYPTKMRLSYSAPTKYVPFSGTEVFLALFLFAEIIHEIGEVLELRRELVIRDPYFRDDWNIVDVLNSTGGLVWFVLRCIPSQFIAARVTLSLLAIPWSIGLLRFFSVNKTLGELVIIIRAMLQDLTAFVSVYIVMIAGFGVAFRGLFADTTAYATMPDTFLALFSGTLSNFSFESFETGNRGVNSLGILLTLVFVVMTAILLINLLIAKMSTSFQRVSDKSQMEWAFERAKLVRSLTLIREKEVWNILPAPLNLIPIVVTCGGVADYNVFQRRTLLAYQRQWLSIPARWLLPAASESTEGGEEGGGGGSGAISNAAAATGAGPATRTVPGTATAARSTTSNERHPSSDDDAANAAAHDDGYFLLSIRGTVANITLFFVYFPLAKILEVCLAFAYAFVLLGRDESGTHPPGSLLNLSPKEVVVFFAQTVFYLVIYVPLFIVEMLRSLTKAEWMLRPWVSYLHDVDQHLVSYTEKFLLIEAAYVRQRYEAAALASAAVAAATGAAASSSPSPSSPSSPSAAASDDAAGANGDDDHASPHSSGSRSSKKRQSLPRRRQLPGRKRSAYDATPGDGAGAAGGGGGGGAGGGVGAAMGGANAADDADGDIVTLTRIFRDEDIDVILRPFACSSANSSAMSGGYGSGSGGGGGAGGAGAGAGGGGGATMPAAMAVNQQVMLLLLEEHNDRVQALQAALATALAEQRQLRVVNHEMHTILRTLLPTAAPLTLPPTAAVPGAGAAPMVSDVPPAAATTTMTPSMGSNATSASPGSGNGNAAASSTLLTPATVPASQPPALTTPVDSESVYAHPLMSTLERMGASLRQLGPADPAANGGGPSTVVGPSAGDNPIDFSFLRPRAMSLKLAARLSNVHTHATGFAAAAAATAAAVSSAAAVTSSAAAAATAAFGGVGSSSSSSSSAAAPMPPLHGRSRPPMPPPPKPLRRPRQPPTGGSGDANSPPPLGHPPHRK